MTGQLSTAFTPEAMAAAFNGVPMLNGDINFIMTAMAELIRVRQPAAGDTATLEAIADDAVALSNAIYARLEQQFSEPDNAPAQAASRGSASLGEMEANA